MEKYQMLFSPCKIGSLEIKNRIIMTAMGTGMGIDGCVSDQMLEFYTARARGGVGLIITECAQVNERNGFSQPGQLSWASDRIIPSARRLADSLHRYGAKLFPQIWHPGREMGAANSHGVQPVSASDVPSIISGLTPRPLSTEEVYGIIDDFVEAAARVQRAGADGVELHAGHGYLLSQFLSPHTNKRSDEFGGGTEARAKIVIDIIKGIRSRCGDFPIMVRTEVEEFIGPKGIELPEGIRICKLLEAAGADALNVTCGGYDSMNHCTEPFTLKEGWRTYLAGEVRKAVSIPVSGNGKIRHPQLAEKLLEEGNQDFIGMARTHLADPEWANKVKSGREDQIRYCISCMHCSESRAQCGRTGQPYHCAVNPLMGRELLYSELKQNGAGRIVAVIGGGPSGMQAAVTLAERKFKPILFERETELGGQLRYAREARDAYRLDWFIEYLEHRMALLGVDVRLGSSPTVEEIEALQPFAVIVASGGVPVKPAGIPGVQGKNVHLTTDILSGTVKFSGKKVAVIGSGITGLEVAEIIAAQGNDVHVVEMAPKLTPDGYWQITQTIMEQLMEQGVSFYPGHKLTAICDDRVLLEGVCAELPADEVVLAMGVRRVDEMYKKLKPRMPNVFCTGDAAVQGKIYQATESAFFAAYYLDN